MIITNQSIPSSATDSYAELRVEDIDRVWPPSTRDSSRYSRGGTNSTDHSQLSSTAPLIPMDTSFNEYGSYRSASPTLSSSSSLSNTSFEGFGHLASEDASHMGSDRMMEFRVLENQIQSLRAFEVRTFWIIKSNYLWTLS